MSRAISPLRATFLFLPLPSSDSTLTFSVPYLSFRTFLLSLCLPLPAAGLPLRVEIPWPSFPKSFAFFFLSPRADELLQWGGGWGTPWKMRAGLNE